MLRFPEKKYFFISKDTGEIFKIQIKFVRLDQIGRNLR